MSVELKTVDSIHDAEAPLLEISSVKLPLCKYVHQNAKTASKMGLLPVNNIKKVFIRQHGTLGFLLNPCEVFKFPDTHTFFIYGEVRHCGKLAPAISDAAAIAVTDAAMGEVFEAMATKRALPNNFINESGILIHNNNNNNNKNNNNMYETPERYSNYSAGSLGLSKDSSSRASTRRSDKKERNSGKRNNNNDNNNNNNNKNKKGKNSKKKKRLIINNNNNRGIKSTGVNNNNNNNKETINIRKSQFLPSEGAGNNKSAKKKRSETAKKANGRKRKRNRLQRLGQTAENNNGHVMQPMSAQFKKTKKIRKSALDKEYFRIINEAQEEEGEGEYEEGREYPQGVGEGCYENAEKGKYMEGKGCVEGDENTEEDENDNNDNNQGKTRGIDETGEKTKTPVNYMDVEGYSVGDEDLNKNKGNERGVGDKEGNNDNNEGKERNIDAKEGKNKNKEKSGGSHVHPDGVKICKICEENWKTEFNTPFIGDDLDPRAVRVVMRVSGTDYETSVHALKMNGGCMVEAAFDLAVGLSLKEES